MNLFPVCDVSAGPRAQQMERLRAEMLQRGAAQAPQAGAGGEASAPHSHFSLLFQENKIDRNEFAVKSEKVWSSMEEVEQCNMLSDNSLQ